MFNYHNVFKLIFFLRKMEGDKESHIDDNEKKDSEHESEIQSLVEDKTQISIDNNPDKKFKPAEFKKTVKKNPWIIATIVLGIIALIFLVLMLRGGITGNIITGKVIGGEDAGDKLIDYLNSRTGGGIEYVSHEDVGNLYEVFVLYQEQEIPVYITKDGEYFVQGVVSLNEPVISPDQQGLQGPLQNKSENENIETFYDSEKEVCFDNGKPIIRLYSSSGCGYCSWSAPIYEKVVKEYVEQGKIVAYLWEDNIKDLLNDIEMPQEEKDLFYEYSSGGVPVFVFGCKYYRVGAPYSREENGEQLEEQELRNVIDDLLA